MQEFVNGAKEILNYAAEHGGSTLLSWYTFFYIAKGFVHLLFDLVVGMGLILAFSWGFFWLAREVRKERRDQEEHEARMRGWDRRR